MNENLKHDRDYLELAIFGSKFEIRLESPHIAENTYLNLEHVQLHDYRTDL